MTSKKPAAQSPFNHIIVGVDFSNYSKIVVKQAEKLAKQFHAKLILVHAAFVNWQAVSPEVYVPQVSLEDLRKSIEKFYQVRPSPSLTIEVRDTPPTETVLEIASQVSHPLIIVGSRGKEAISRYILGSHAEKIALKSPYPVWVHRGRKIVPLKKVLVPTDLSASSRQHIARMTQWSRKFPMSLNFLFVQPEMRQSPVSFEMLQQIRKNIEKSLSRFRQRTPHLPLKTAVSDDPSVKISGLGKKYDVIAMNPHDRTGLFNRFGRVTAKVIRIADTPVLVMKT